MTGELVVKLWVSSSAVDTDFTAKLVDVYPASADFPGGFDLNIGDGILRARFRESLAQEKLMTPGTVYPLTIKLYPTSNIFKRGHRIRVDISSSNFPRFDVNPNTGEPLERQPADRSGHQHGATTTPIIRRTSCCRSCRPRRRRPRASKLIRCGNTAELDNPTNQLCSIERA